MITSPSEGYNKKSWRTGKTSGWAAFDFEQRQKATPRSGDHNEPFPSISRSILGSNGNLSIPERPFASVVLDPVNVLRSGDGASLDKQQWTNSGSSKTIEAERNANERTGESSDSKAREILKERYPWADDSLIEDVLAAVANDIEWASNSLKSMLFPANTLMENEDVESKGFECALQDLSFVHMEKSVKDVTTDLAKLSHLLEDCKYGNHEPSHNADNLETFENYLNSIPTEPEWEEDDVYLVHRKEALRMMRSASRHSKAANDCYLRGEHSRAQQYSQRAREEWMTANNLNDMAATEILRIRNAKNDQWTVDLHGLHASEAVRALEERLRTIECELPVSQSISTNSIERKPDNIVSAPFVSLGFSDVAKLSRHPLTGSRPRHSRVPLQVITGKGNHSRGEAALPTAIKRFLTENGYQFDETRPGMITVRPKFRL